MHYLLYFPRTVGIDPLAILAKCGIADLARGQAPELFPLERGPDGGPGLLAAWRGAQDPPVGLSDTQEWKPCRPGAGVSGLGAGDYWVGIERRQAIRPEHLARKEPMPGYWVPLADGQKWHVPAASRLPHVHGINEAGLHQREIAAEFGRFFEKSRTFAVQLLEAAGQLLLLEKLQPTKEGERTSKVELDLAETFAFCVEALAFNYRVNAEIVTRLGLFDDEALRNVVKAVVDLPVLMRSESEKKKPPYLEVPVSTTAG